jgi:magnesium transporter
MVNVLIRENEHLVLYKDVKEIDKCHVHDIVWVDMMSPHESERAYIEDYFQVKLGSQHELQEIESSSRFYEKEDFIVANSNFMVIKDSDYANEPVSFLFKENTLISFRNCELKSFTETYKKMEFAPRLITSGPNAFIILFETRIDLDADLIEGISKEISAISKRITFTKKLDEETILRLTKCQETAMLVHENIVDKQRVVSAILKSDFFPKETYEKLTIIIKDINSLLDHTAFSFERLEYLQNTFLGLVNIEQNKIIKIFTVVTVVLMPPTLVASIYGMNFRSLPELEWRFGYPFAVFLMVLSSASALYFFRRKKWL